MKIIGTYGTLKRGEYNHERYGKNTLKFINTGTILAGTLYTNSKYPALTTGFHRQMNDHIIELFEVENDIFEMIRRMEEGAGYITVLKKVYFKEPPSITAYVWLLTDKDIESQNKEQQKWTPIESWPIPKTAPVK